MATDLTSKVCLVTGATSGIGWETAKALATRGATVALVGRDAERTQKAIDGIRASAPNAQLESYLADLSAQEQVRRLAREFQSRHDRLDVLINDAGAMFPTRKTSVDGIEMTLALNHLAPFLLTNLLLDTLKASAPSRVVTVSSDAHQSAKVNFDDLQLARGYGPWRAYGQSKLMNVLFTNELARRLAGSGVTANALHPGFVASNFGKSEGAFWAAFTLMRPFMISAEKGAQTVIYLASSPDVAGATGGYYVKCKPARSSSIARDEATARRLWEVSERLTGLPVIV
ncbi:MAG TPA: SDR family oxidoreductase [Ktedonobacterales bacterium]|jgi:NAD(P)-dependent dehydrogenase (short-subunit alcohol dehydrogenase family)